MAPAYATIFMAALEETFLSECDNKPEAWWRYIDDIFIIWKHREDSLGQFLEKLNSFHPTIKFTSHWSKQSVNFLDVQVSVDNGYLKTDLYIKPTDTHQFLHPSSCHPYHCKKAIPYSQALRFNRICSDDDDFEGRCDDLKSWLTGRGYKSELVDEQIFKACDFSRDELLDKEPRAKEYKLTFNTTYHPSFSNIFKILRELQVILQSDNEHRKTFSAVPIVGFSNGKSLKRHLVRATLSKTNNKVGSFNCGGGARRRCQVCQHIKVTDSFTSNVNGEEFKIHKGTLDCNSKMVVYSM